MARLAKPTLNDYILGIPDLELIIKNIPMESTPILNTLGRNIYTEVITEAYWRRKEAIDNFVVWKGPSPIISEKAGQLTKIQKK